MDTSQNNNEDDLDIYSNLPNFHYDESLQKLEQQNKDLQDTLDDLEKKISSLTVELNTCRQQKQQLEKNISCLYKSAKQEIQRKDKRIGELISKDVSSRSGRQSFSKSADSSGYYRSQSRDDDKRKEFSNTKKQTSVTGRQCADHQYSTRSKTRSSENKNLSSKTSLSSTKKKDDSPKSRNERKSAKNVDNRNSYVSPKKKPVKVFVPEKVEDMYPEQKPIIDEPIPVEDDVLNVTENLSTSNSDNCKVINFLPRVILPKFEGPRTTFSIRRYKKLYGVSPFKDSPQESIIPPPSSIRKLVTDENPCTDFKIKSEIVEDDDDDIKPHSSLTKIRSSNNKDLDVSDSNHVDSDKTRLIDNLELRKVTVCDKVTSKTFKSFQPQVRLETIKMSACETVNGSNNKTMCTYVDQGKKSLQIDDKKDRKTESSVKERLNPSHEVSKKTVVPSKDVEVVKDSVSLCSSLENIPVVNKESINRTSLSDDCQIVKEPVKPTVSNNIQSLKNVTENEHVDKLKNKRLSTEKQASEKSCLDKNEDSHDSYTLEIIKTPPTTPKRIDVSQPITANNLDARINKCSEEISNEDSKLISGEVSSNISKTIVLNPLISNKEEIVNNLKINDDIVPEEKSIFKLSETVVTKKQTTINGSDNIADVRLNELFGDSPFKSNDNNVLCDNNSVADKINIFLNQPCEASVEATEEYSNRISDDIDKKMLIIPNISKPFSNFKEAFQQGKLEKSPSPDKEIKSTVNNTNGSKNLLDKENPNINLNQKTLVSLTDMKNILCDKKQNDCNITNSICTQINITVKVNEDNIKTSNSCKPIEMGFTPGLFGSEVKTNNKPCVESNKGNSNLDVCVLKTTENSILTSGDDTTLHMIKRFAKIEDFLSPIKTPLKHFGEDSITMNGEVGKNVTADKSVSKLIDSKVLSQNLTLNKLHSKFGCVIAPIQTPYNQLKHEVVVDRVNNFISESNKSEVNCTTQNVVKKDDVSTSVSSEQCEFKRRRGVRKIIKVNTVITNNCNIVKIDNKAIEETNKCEDVKSKHMISNINKNLEEESKGVDNVNIDSVNSKEEEDKQLKETIEDKDKGNVITDNSKKVGIKRSHISDLNNESFQFSNRKRRRIISIKNISTDVKSKKDESDEINSDKVLDKVKSVNKLQINGHLLIEKVKRDSNIKNTIIDRHEKLKGRVIRRSRSRSVKKEIRTYKQEDKIEKKLKKDSLNNKMNVSSSLHRFDIKQSSSLNSSLCERRSPSEYFNRQQSRLITERLYKTRIGIRKPLRFRSKSPTPVRTIKKRKLTDRRSNLNVEVNLKKVTKTGNNKKDVTKLIGMSPKVEQQNLNESPKKVEGGSEISIKRLSESPLSLNKTTCNESSVKTPVNCSMAWKICPLDVNKVSSNLIDRFVHSKAIPEYLKLENKVLNTNATVNEPNNISSNLPVNEIKNPVSNTLIIQRRMRIRRVGERKLEDSAVLSSNTSPIPVKKLDTQSEMNIKTISIDNNKNIPICNEQIEVLKLKQPIQKGRCIVKTPLDFKTKFSVSSTESDERHHRSRSEESQLSDESWRPRKSYKKKKQR